MSSAEYYAPSGAPANSSDLSSATMRAELALIRDGFGKMPDLSGNGGKIVRVNSGATRLEAVDSISLTALTVTSAATTGNGVSITANSLTTGSALSISAIDAGTTEKHLLDVQYAAGPTANGVPGRFYTGSAGPCLRVHQDGGAGGFIDFVGTGASIGASVGAFAGTVRIEVNGSTYHLAVYASP